ncbi:MAG: hypothetical protein IIA40_02545 [SAR324 cluster bacterium]|nr:hypothetical protein [SAR324 cluster bacterium]
MGNSEYSSPAPGISHILGMARHRKIGAVVMVSIDRVFRNMRESFEAEGQR